MGSPIRSCGCASHLSIDRKLHLSGIACTTAPLRLLAPSALPTEGKALQPSPASCHPA